jgi:asparagine synthase (glutamine-hydrolysing)
LGDLYVRGSLMVAVLGRVRFAERNLRELSEREGAAAALASLFASVGERAFAGLAGEFLAAIVDEASNSAYIAIDRMGAHSLTYTLSDGAFLFSTSAEAINAHPLAKKEIDPQAIYQYLYLMVPAPATIYRGQHRLLPGEYVVRGRQRTHSSLHMRFDETFADLKERVHDYLREAVREASGTGTGAFLSGGTDSSAIPAAR